MSDTLPKLTEWEAWRQIAAWLETNALVSAGADNDCSYEFPATRHGVCVLVSALKHRRQISYDQWERMGRRLKAVFDRRPEERYRELGYYWPLTPAGREKRIRACRVLAAMTEPAT